jgi:membrane protease YdiL (CAAX protease family)
VKARRTGTAGAVENQGPKERRWFWPKSTLLRGPAAYQARSPWRPGLALLATIAIAGLSFAAAVLLTRLAGDGGYLGIGRGRTGGDQAAVSLQLFAIWQGMVVLLTLAASVLFRGRVRDVLALRAAVGGWRTYAGAILGLIGLQIALAAVQHGLLRQDLLTDLRPFVNLVRGPDWLLTAAVVGVGAPLSEELLFRGFLLSALARTGLGFWGAAVVATLLWTAMHVGYSLTGIVEVFIIGMFFSWLLWRTGSLRVAIFCHALYNLLIVLGLRFVDLPAPT